MEGKLLLLPGTPAARDAAARRVQAAGRFWPGRHCPGPGGHLIQAMMITMPETESACGVPSCDQTDEMMSSTTLDYDKVKPGQVTEEMVGSLPGIKSIGEGDEDEVMTDYKEVASPEFFITPRYALNNDKSTTPCSPAYLAIIFRFDQLREMLYSTMKEDKEFCRKMLSSKDPIVAGEPSLMNTALTYHEAALDEMLRLARHHNILQEVLTAAQDSEGHNLLHLTAKNMEIHPYIKMMLDGPEEREGEGPMEEEDQQRFDVRKTDSLNLQKILLTSRNNKEQSVLHTVVDTAVLDYLLKTSKDDPFYKERSDMIHSRDAQGENALSSFIKRDELDLAKRFLDNHIVSENLQTIEGKSESKKFALRLDLNPMIAMKTKDHESDELKVIHQLLPLNSERKELLLHPIINTFIMIKYNSYAIPLMFIIAIRFMLSALMTDIILKHDMGQNTTQRATIGFIEKPISFWISFSFVTFVLVINLIYTIIYTMVINFRRLDRRQIMFKAMGVVFYMSSLIFLAFLAIGQVNNRCAGLIVLACWANFTTSLRFLMLGELYNLGLYIRMVNQIGQKIAILLAVYSFILFGFTVAFSILMPEQFKGPWQVGMMAMLIGELEFGDNLESESVTSKVVFLFFVILVPIIINNLLIGLTINDVDDLIKNANMSGLQFKLRQIDMFDRSHMMRLLSRLAKYSNAQSHLLSYKHNSLEVAIKPHESQENLLSKEPITNIFEVQMEGGERKIGDKWGFLGVRTFVPFSVVGAAREAIERLHQGEKKKEKG